jgi:hypothetical protein
MKFNQKFDEIQSKINEKVDEIQSKINEKVEILLEINCKQKI